MNRGGRKGGRFVDNDNGDDTGKKTKMERGRRKKGGGEKGKKEDSQKKR